MRNVKNILRHEIIGLNCEITTSKNRFNKGIKGRIINETMKTVVLETAKGRKQVEKTGTMFCLFLNDKKVFVDGNHLLARPEDRIKKQIKKW